MCAQIRRATMCKLDGYMSFRQSARTSNVPEGYPSGFLLPCRGVVDIIAFRLSTLCCDSGRLKMAILSSRAFSSLFSGHNSFLHEQVNHESGQAHSESLTTPAGCRAHYHKVLTKQSKYLHHQPRTVLFCFPSTICRALINIVSSV